MHVNTPPTARPRASLSLLIAGLVTLALLKAGLAHANGEERLDHFLSMSLADLMDMEVSISTHMKQTLSKAPAVVTVITAEDIQATGATNLTEVLQGVPGIYIRNNLFAFRPLVTFRGATGPHTLLMVDGAPVKDLVWSTGIFWKGLPTHMIERIEIIRGPGSALFGSDASAGVVNVITKTAGKIRQSEAGLRLGSYDSQEAWLHHGTQWNGFDIGVTAQVSRTDGHDPLIVADDQTFRDAAILSSDPGYTPVSTAPDRAGYGWRNLDLRFAMAKGPWRMQADYQRHGDVEIGLTGAGVLDPTTRAGDSRANLALIYDAPAQDGDWGLNAELRYQHLDYTSGNGFQERPPGYTVPKPGPDDVYPDGQLNLMRAAEHRLSLELSGLYSGLRDHAIRLGGGHVLQNPYRIEQYVNYGLGPTRAPLPAGGPLVELSDSPYAFAPEKARQISYLFAQDVWRLAPDWELTVGARHDHYSDFGDAFSPRLALVWQGTPRLSSKLMYGKAFRAPSYLELYAPTSATKPNPNLAPERSRTWELSFDYAVSRDLRMRLGVYEFKQCNLIGADASNTYQNLGRANSRGAELEAQWQATPAFRVSGNLALREDDYASPPAFIVPRRQAYLRTDWALLPRWHWNVQANWVGRHEIPPAKPGEVDLRGPIGAYAIVDTTLRHAQGKDWEFAASIRNLFDKDVRELSAKKLPDNLPLPGRHFYVEARYSF